MKNIHNSASIHSKESSNSNSSTINQEDKKFLEEQIQWCKQQDLILEEIEMKLYEMKKIAQYSLEHNLTPIELEQLNTQLNELKDEVHFLQKKLDSVVH
jgi:hypothetical protein